MTSNDIIINNSLIFIIQLKSVNKPKSGNVSYKIKLNIISNNTNLLRIIYSISITVLYIILSIKRISASDGNRTRKDYFSPRDFKSLVFTNFTTKAEESTMCFTTNSTYKMYRILNSTKN